jgi:hypothetical protein
MAQLDKRKLIMVLGMMGSSHDGEVVNAARQAHQMLRAVGLTWRDVIKADFDKTAYQRAYMRKRRANERTRRAAQ